MIFASIDSEVAAPPWDTPPPPSAPQGPKRKLSKLGTQFQEATKGDKQRACQLSCFSETRAERGVAPSPCYSSQRRLRPWPLRCPTGGC